MALQANGLRNMVIGSLDNVGKFLTQDEHYSSVPLVDWVPNRLRTVGVNFKQRGLDAADSNFKATPRAEGWKGWVEFPDVMVAPYATEAGLQKVYDAGLTVNPTPDETFPESLRRIRDDYRFESNTDNIYGRNHQYTQVPSEHKEYIALPPGERVAAIIGRYPIRTAGAVGGALTVDTVLGNPVLGTVGGVVDGATFGLTNFKPNEEDMMENPYPPSPEKQVAMEGVNVMQPTGMAGGVYQPNAEEMQREHDRLQRMMGFNQMTLQEIRRRQAMTGSQPNQW